MTDCSQLSSTPDILTVTSHSSRGVSSRLRSFRSFLVSDYGFVLGTVFCLRHLKKSVKAKTTECSHFTFLQFCVCVCVDVCVCVCSGVGGGGRCNLFTVVHETIVFFSTLSDSLKRGVYLDTNYLLVMSLLSCR